MSRFLSNDDNVKKETIDPMLENTVKDFTIVINGESHEILSFIAATLSQRIFFLIAENSNADKLEINTDKGPTKLVADFLMKKKIEIDDDNSIFFFKVGCELISQQLVNLSMPFILKRNEMELVAELFKLGFDKHVNCEALVFTILKKFKEYEPYLMKYSDDLIDLLLQNNFLEAKAEDVFEFLSKRIDFKKDYNNRLIKFIDPRFFANERVFSILYNQDFNLNRFRYYLLKNPLISSKYQDSNASENGYKHIIKCGIIPVIRSSEPYNEKYLGSNILSADNDNYFCSKNSNSEYLIFDFSPYKVVASAIILRSWKLGLNGVCPRTFTFEYSNDGENWVIAFTANEDTSLIGNNRTSVFNLLVPTECVSYFKIKQITSNNLANPRFAISYFDIIGDYVK